MSENDKTTATDGSEGAKAQAAAEAGAQPGAPAEAAPEGPEAKLARLERERAELHDRLLRTAADFENYKRRTRREMDEAAHRGREALLKELLPALDNLDRALGAIAQGGSIEALGEGVRLVEKQFHSVLEKFDVRRFEALGQPFDPARHEAIQQVETDAHPPGTVAQVFARGYTLGERLLRAALVAVAKGKPRPAETSAPSGDGAPPEDQVH